MRTRAKGISRAAVVAAGFVALGVTATPSHADVTSGNGGVLSGNQIDIPVSVPVDVSGNGASLLGTSHAASKGGAKVRKTGGGAQQTSGNHGIASGNQINAPISLPVNVCGNGAAVLGHADAGCKGGAKVEDGGSGDQATSGSGGILAGNQVNAPISLPVNVCGNAAAIAGAAVAGCEGGAKVKNGGHTGSGQETSGVLGIGSGNQANLPISIPVDICGNAVGNAAAACAGGASVRNGGHRTGRQATNGALGVIAGNQANAPISLPLNVCGNAAAIVGQAGAFCEGGSHVRSPSGGDLHTSGTAGILAGNQAHAPAKIPANVCGNAAALVGQASALCHGDHGGYGGHDGYGDHDGYRTTTPPTLPLLNAQPNAGDMVTLNALPGLGGTSPISALPELGVPASDARTKPNHASPSSALKPLKLPATGGLTEVKGVPGARSADDVIPGQGGSSPVSALPGAGALKVVKLPATGGLTKRPTGGVVPGLGASSPVGALPGAGDLKVVPATGLLSGVPVSGARSHMPGSGALPGVGDLKVVELPATGGLTKRSAGGVVPGLGASSPVGALPGAGDLKVVELPATSGLGERSAGGVVPGLGGSSPVGALPGVGGLEAVDLPGARVPASGAVRPKAGALKVVRMPAAGALAGVPGAGARANSHHVPVVGVPSEGAEVVRLPVACGLNGKVPGTAGGVVVPGSPVVPSLQAAGLAKDGGIELPAGVGPVKHVSAEQAIAAEDSAGATWTFGAAALLAFMAGALGLTRRLRPGRR